MSPSAWTRGNGRAIFHTLHYANAPEMIGFDPFVDLVDLILERAAGVEALATA